MSGFDSDDFDGSYSECSKSMGPKAKKGGCNPFCKSSKKDDDFHFDSPFNSSEEERDDESSASAEPAHSSASAP